MRNTVLRPTPRVWKSNCFPPRLDELQAVVHPFKLPLFAFRCHFGNHKVVLLASRIDVRFFFQSCRSFMCGIVYGSQMEKSTTSLHAWIEYSTLIRVVVSERQGSRSLVGFVL